MGKIWEFYEKLNEIVYVCDIDTYELEYMNRKACEMYGLSSFDEVKGKKCYEVLQNETAPCKFCTNKCLKEGCFYEWQHFNTELEKTLSVKDTLVVEDGKRYRMELAFDMAIQEEQKKIVQEYISNESMVNEGLRIALSEANPVRSIEVLLAYLGTNLRSERVYIFEENSERTLDNTFEWCGDGILPQKDILQKVPFEVAALWYESFRRNESFIIKDVEAIWDETPLAYEYLYPQGIHSLVVSPIYEEDRIIGFYGVDNPPKELLDHISTLLWIVGYFISGLLKRRALIKRLEEMSMQDQLTKLGNRHAMIECQNNWNRNESIGMLYCDVMGLKRINDEYGHQEGDHLLLRASHCLKRSFHGQQLFRIGGDEFLVLCRGLTEEEIRNRIQKLKKDMKASEAMMALGLVWEPNADRDFEEMMAEADGLMYQDKRAYYEGKQ